LFVALGALVAAFFLLRPATTHTLIPRLFHRSNVASAAEVARIDIEKAAAISPLRGRIVAIAESQVGYRTDPSNTYCNKYSAYWISGTSNCGNGNLDEEWCADFVAWVWQKAGANVTYQYINGDLNSSSASFYEWGTTRGTWHPVGSGYIPQPGDVAVYGLDAAMLVAQHVAIVISYTPGSRGPDAINGDGDRTGFSVVEIGNDEYKADVSSKTDTNISGYVSPS
jgi:hypothetical protein